MRARFESHPDVVALGHGDVLVADCAGVLQAADVEREQLGLGDFAGHPDQLFLDELVAGDGLVVELLADLGVLERGVVAGHGRADGAPTDAVAGLVEAHERALEAAGAGQQVGGGDVDVLQREAAGDGGAQAPLAVDFVGGEAGAIGLDEEAADAIVFVFDLGPDDGDVGDGAGGDPHLFAVEDVLVARPCGRWWSCRRDWSRSRAR